MSVIYEKHYPHPTFEEEMKELEEYEKEMESSPDYIPEPEMTFDEFLTKMVDYLKKALIYGHTSRISS